MMVSGKTYCLKCYTPHLCHCGPKYRISYTHKLRPPTSIKNKVEFRKFLDACPQFVNLVDSTQQEMFLNLLRKVKYFNHTINGRQWTNISK